MIRPQALSLTLLAPADRCNQACPACFITEVAREPVHRFDLSPEDYAQFVSDFVESEHDIQTVSFAGYEVTLPAAWPYVEAAFSVAIRHGLRRSFITNGMLLSKWTDRIDALDLHQITVSLDGATAAENDRLRGLPGAFGATVRSVTRFAEAAPRFRSRLVVASCLYDDANVASLEEMPRLLASLGIRGWTLSAVARSSNRCIEFPRGDRFQNGLSPWRLLRNRLISRSAGSTSTVVVRRFRKAFGQCRSQRRTRSYVSTRRDTSGQETIFCVCTRPASPADGTRRQKVRRRQCSARGCRDRRATTVTIRPSRSRPDRDGPSEF